MTLPVPRSLRAQLLGATLLVGVCSAVLTLVVGAALTRRAVDRSELRDVSQQAALLAERERVALCPLCHLDALRSFLGKQDEQVVVAPLDRPSTYLNAAAAARLRATGAAQGTVAVGGKDWFFAARTVAGRGLVLLRPRAVGAAVWRPYLGGLLIAAGAGALLAAGISFLLARRIARPLRGIVEATQRLAAGLDRVTAAEDGPTELVSLARSFNEMASRLAHARDAERAFLLSVSHELKTPLTAILGYAEGLADGTVGAEEAAHTIGKEAERLDRLVRDVLDLARMNRSEFSVRTELVDLAEVAAECARRHQARAESYGIALELDTTEAYATGDCDRVVQALSNLVENALRISPSGATMRIVARPRLLAVEDEGPGLQPDEIPHAFERFFLFARYAGRRPVGTGLGLAIVEQLASAMGGSVSVDSEPGRTRFSLNLRAADRVPVTAA
jgi:two-component system, OmpR family, sensor kinase